MSTPTSASEWKKNTAGEAVPLPSGHTALLRRPGMEALFAAGVLPDELTKIALDQIKAAEKGPQDHLRPAKDQNAIDPELMEKFMNGENAIADIFESFDRVTAMCVVQPECHFHKRRLVDDQGHQIVDEKDKAIWEAIPEDERDENILYTDEVEMDDKSFIFNYVVGGSRDLSTFRQESSDDVAVVQSGEDVDVPTVGTPES